MILVQAAPFDLGEQTASFAARQTGAGAVVTFSGLVRGDNGLTALEIEHYPAMTAPAITAMTAQAAARFDLLDVLVIHRFGVLHVAEPIMMVATAALHRKNAFDGAEFLMDYLKSRAPFWKKEHRPNGATWVKAKDSDEALLSRWA